MAKKITKNIFINEIKNIYGNKFKILNFTNYKDDCEILHFKCNNTFKIKPSQIYLIKNRNSYLNDTCPKCRKSHLLRSKEDINEQLKELTNNKIQIIDNNYKNLHSSTLCKCNICNNEFKTRISSLIENVKKNKTNSFGCPFCSNKHKMTSTEIKNKLFLTVGEEYELKSEYINNSTKIELLHKKCNQIYSVTPDKFFNRGDRCPCETNKINSKMVKIIQNYLDENNIQYEKEYKFDNLFYKNKKYPLKYDFYLNDLNILIEFDGSQHFKKKFYEEEFNNTHSRDILKNNFCFENNITFLRIPYKLNEKIIKIIIKNLLNKNEDVLISYIKKYNLLYHNENITYNISNYYKTYMLG